MIANEGQACKAQHCVDKASREAKIARKANPIELKKCKVLSDVEAIEKKQVSIFQHR